MAEIVVWCDGGMIGDRNPSPDGVYWSVGWDGPDGWVQHRAEAPELSTNNEAEYRALIDAITRGADLVGPGDALVIRSDSQLVVRQFTGRYRCGSARLRPLLAMARTRFRDLPAGSRVEWVPRKQVVARLGH